MQCWLRPKVSRKRAVQSKLESLVPTLSQCDAGDAASTHSLGCAFVKTCLPSLRQCAGPCWWALAEVASKRGWRPCLADWQVSDRDGDGIFRSEVSPSCLQDQTPACFAVLLRGHFSKMNSSIWECDELYLPLLSYRSEERTVCLRLGHREVLWKIQKLRNTKPLYSVVKIIIRFSKRNISNILISSNKRFDQEIDCRIFSNE